MRPWFDSKRLCALLLSLSAIALVPAPSAFAATKRVVVTAPQITGFEMEPAQTVAAGNELFFRVQGTPGARVTVRVGGVARTLPLQEVDDGVYEGGYTLRPADRTNANSAATVTMRRNGRSSTSTMARLAGAAPPVAAAPAPQPARLSAIALNRFIATPV